MMKQEQEMKFKLKMFGGKVDKISHSWFYIKSAQEHENKTKLTIKLQKRKRHREEVNWKND